MACLGEKPKWGKGGITVVWRRNKYGRIDEWGNKSRCGGQCCYLAMPSPWPMLLVLSSSQPPLLTPNIQCACACVCGETIEWKPCVVTGSQVLQCSSWREWRGLSTVWHLGGCGSEGLESWGSCTCVLWVCISAGVITGQTTLVLSGRWGHEPGLDTGEVRGCVIWVLEEAGSPHQTRDRPVCAGGWWSRGWLLNRLGICGQFLKGYIMYQCMYSILNSFHPGQPERRAGRGCWCSLCLPRYSIDLVFFQSVLVCVVGYWYVYKCIVCICLTTGWMWGCGAATALPLSGYQSQQPPT